MRVKNRELFYISLVFLLTVIAWIAVEIYGIKKNKEFVIDYQKSSTIKIDQIQDLKVIDNLEKRK